MRNVNRACERPPAGRCAPRLSPFVRGTLTKGTTAFSGPTSDLVEPPQAVGSVPLTKGDSRGAQRPAGGRSQALFILLSLSLCFSILVQAQTQRTVWDGVYTEEQSQRGRAIFLDACSNCHGRDLEGADMTPPLTGGAFMANWDGLTLGDLAERIRNTMPLNAPGTISRQDSAEIVAYILKFNQFPAGKNELPREVPAMKQILFKASKP